MTKRTSALRSDLRLDAGSLLGVSIANTSLPSARLRRRGRSGLVSSLLALLSFVALSMAGVVAYAWMQGQL